VSRVLALDLGTKRIGVAASDPGQILASPHTVLARARTHAEDHRAIAAIVDELGAERVVVGLPLQLDGRQGLAAQSALSEVDELAAVLPVPVETWDERLTTVAADRSMMARGMKAPARRKVVDQVAAAVLLQSWLDRRG
jgi:putative Holliday junction resolvase